jgi:Uma2 family endonuclease
MAVATKLWTIEDLEAKENDGARYELLRGELIEVPGPKFEHWFLVGLLLRIFSNFVAERGLGLVGNNGAFVIRRDPDILLIPDVAFINSARIPPLDADWEIYLGPPDAALEVVLPSDSALDVHDKILAYLDGGVRVVVAVWPRSRSVSVHRPGGETREFKVGDVLEIEDVLPGFRLPIADIFNRDAPPAIDPVANRGAAT